MRQGVLVITEFPQRVFVAEASSRPQSMDEAAFRSLYSDTAPMLWSYIQRASGDGALADDISQEAFFRFLRANPPMTEKAQMKAYLYRIANSLLVDHWRRLKRERRWSLANWFGEGCAKSTDAGGETLSVFSRLKPQEQSLLWLAYVEGFDHREIASALQLREKSIRVLLFRARKRLASMLKKQGVEIEEAR